MDNQGRFFGTPALKAVGVAAALGLSATVGLVVSKGDGTFTVSTGDATSNDAGVVTVAKVNGITYPSGSLTTGTVPRATGTSTVAYGALDLANTNAVTGALPNANQAAQTLAGDVTGTTAASVVEKCTGAAGVCTIPASTSLNFGTTGIPTTGDIRLGPSGTIRSTDGSGNNVNILSMNGSGTETFGGSTFTANQVHAVKTGGTHKFQVNGTDAATIGAGYIGLGSAAVSSAGDVRFGASGSLKALNDSAADINLVSWASGVFTYGGTVNTGIAFGTSTSALHKFQHNAQDSLQLASSGVSTSFPTVGVERFQSQVVMAASRNAADSGNLYLLSTNSANHLNIGADTVGGNSNLGAVNLFGTNAITFYAGSTTTTNTVSFTLNSMAIATGQTPVWLQTVHTTDAATHNWILRAQGAWSSAATNVNGGALVLQGGVAKTDGTTGLRKGVRVDLSSNAVTMIEATEPAVGRRIVALTRGAAITTTEMPTNSGDLVEYHGDAATAPTVSAVSGHISYSVSGSPYWMLPSNHSIGITSNAATTATNGDGELVKTNVQGYITAVVDGTTVKIPFYKN